MPRGRQYYDPIVQVPGAIDANQDLSRIELYQDDDLRWKGRLIDAKGAIEKIAPGDFDHDGALAQAEALWPGLSVYELRDKYQDSTWEGTGPSPRTWQGSAPAELDLTEMVKEVVVNNDVDAVRAAQELAEFSAEDESPEVAAHGEIRGIMVTAPGMYVSLTDVCDLLVAWAEQYEGNPSAELALREASGALREAYGLPR